MRRIIRIPWWESCLWLTLALFSDPDQPLHWSSLLFALAGFFLRLWFFQDIRSGDLKDRQLSWSLLRHPFETGGMLILCGLGLASSGLSVFACCFLLAGLLFYRQIRQFSLHLGNEGEAILVGQRLNLPAMSPAFLKIREKEDNLRKLQYFFRDFYHFKPSVQGTLLALSFFIIWLKGLLRFDFWTVL